MAFRIGDILIANEDTPYSITSRGNGNVIVVGVGNYGTNFRNEIDDILVALVKDPEWVRWDVCSRYFTLVTSAGNFTGKKSGFRRVYANRN